jgi:cutinase
VAATLLCPFVYVPTAVAEPCPDVEVVFARGTFEPPGVGVTGQAFVDALRAQLPEKSIEAYPVAYPASLDFARAADGVADASNRVQQIAGTCPKTKVVLGGYSQGAAVIAYITTDEVPVGYVLPAGINGLMPKSVANHVAAVTLFGKPSTGFLNMLDPTAPPINIGGRYSAKALDLCVADDPVCSQGGAPGAHGSYAVNGMADQAAGFRQGPRPVDLTGHIRH